MAKDESKITEEDVWNEHVDNVAVLEHWAYLLGVIIGGFVLMVGLIALLGAAGG
jgi:hypothetical protein